MKKIVMLIIFALSLFAITGCDLEASNSTTTNTNNTTEKNESIQENTNEEKNKEDDTSNVYLESLRKCTVMEAADIYTTGVGKKSDNVFNDGKETCESFYKQWGEKDFVEAVNSDWENRQNEQIDGKPLSYYLDILGW